MFASYYKKLQKHFQIWPAICVGIIIVGSIIYGGIMIFYNENLRGYARLEIDSGGKRRAFEGEVVDNMTVFQALQAATLAGKLAFSYSMDGNSDSIVVKGINGYNSDQDKKQPEFYLNSISLDVSKIGSTLVKSGDNILIVLE